jgi:hypothetical protein
MSLAQSMVWFVLTAFMVVALLAFGMYEGTHAYDARKDGRRHLRDLLHRH